MLELIILLGGSLGERTEGLQQGKRSCGGGGVTEHARSRERGRGNQSGRTSGERDVTQDDGAGQKERNKALCHTRKD